MRSLNLLYGVRTRRQGQCRRLQRELIDRLEGEVNKTGLQMESALSCPAGLRRTRAAATFAAGLLSLGGMVEITKTVPSPSCYSVLVWPAL